MSEIAAGYWPCRVLDGFFGDNDKGIPVVRINVEITDGTHKGHRLTYEESVNNKQAPYIARTCKAVGWKGASMASLKADVAAWVAATGGDSTLEIKHIEVKNGRNAGKIWAKANSIGRGPKPLKQASASNVADVDDMMRAALADDAGSNGSTYDNDAPPPTDDDLPF